MDSLPEVRPRPEAGFKGESVRSHEVCVRATRCRGRRFSPPRAGKGIRSGRLRTSVRCAINRYRAAFTL